MDNNTDIQARASTGGPEQITSAIGRLLENAYRDTGASRRAAQFLLSLWNGQRYKANLQELLYVDAGLFSDMQTVLHELYGKNAQLDTYVTEDRMRPVIELWGSAFESLGK
jgi:hypothetical protein